MRTSVGRRTAGYAVSVLCALTLLSACGSEDPPVAAPSASTPVSTSDPGASTMPSDGRARPVTMAGQVTSTDDGCIVFKNNRDGHRWVLVGETNGLVAGTAYVLQGVAMDSMDPGCSQGLPFLVNEAVPGELEDLRPLPPSTPPGQAMTLTGVVTAGVEAGCRVLQTDRGTFVLMGTVPIPDGTRVTVKGVRRDDVMSICQQGPSFEVVTVTEAD